MDEKVLQSLTALLNSALTSQLVWTAVVSVVAAAFGAYFGSYLGKKGERRAAKEDFSQVLGEELTRTLQTEQVKAAIAEGSSRSLEQVRADIHRDTAFVTFQRELVARHQDGLLSALRDCSILGELALYQWQQDELDQNRVKMTTGLQGIRLSGAMLTALAAIDEAADRKLREAVEEVTRRWEKVFSIKFRNSPRFQSAVPQAPPSGPEAFPDAYAPFERALEQLTNCVVGTVKNCRVPI